MSMILTLTSAAIIAGLSLTQVSVAALVACQDSENLTEGLETVYMDSQILQKTLIEMDCHMKVKSDNEIYVETTCGQLLFKREDVNLPFRLFINDIRDQEGLIQNMKSFELDYGRNVQDYTYHHIKDHLPQGMSIENEYVEDDELYLTINVE